MYAEDMQVPSGGVPNLIQIGSIRLGKHGDQRKA